MTARKLASGVEIEAAGEVGGEDALGVEGHFEIGVDFEGFFAEGAGEMFGGEGGIFGKVEPSAGFENEFVHLVGESPNIVFILLGNFEIEGQGVAIYGVAEQKVIGDMAFENSEKRFELGVLLEFELAGEDAGGMVGGDERLVLDEPAGEIRIAPTGDVIEEETEPDKALGVGFAVAEEFAAGVLSPVGESHSGAIVEKLEEAPNDRFWEEPENGVGEILVFGAKSDRVLARFVKVVARVEITSSGIATACETVDPADHVVGVAS